MQKKQENPREQILNENKQEEQREIGSAHAGRLLWGAVNVYSAIDGGKATENNR